MKKNISLTVLIISILFGMNIANASMITPEELTANKDMKKYMQMSDQEQTERLKIVYFYYEFWYKNIYVLMNKYTLPEYDEKVLYESYGDLTSDKNPLFVDGYSKSAGGQMYDVNRKKFQQAVNYFLGNNTSDGFQRLSKDFVTGELDKDIREHDTLMNIKDAEKVYAKQLYQDFISGFNSDVQLITNIMGDTMYKGECNGIGMDFFVRGKNKKVEYPQLSKYESRCIAGYENPDLDAFKNSFKEFLTGKNSYYSPIDVVVDPDYGNYINNYKIKENLPELVKSQTIPPSGYENGTKPKIKLATSWGIGVQEKYPSPYEKNNVIFNPYTNEINDYIVGIFDVNGNLAYAKYGPYNISQSGDTSLLYNKRWDFYHDNAKGTVKKDLKVTYLKPLYGTQNTLSSKPHYYGNYTGPVLSNQEVLNTQTSSAGDISTSNNGNSIGSPDKNFTIALAGKNIEVTKYNGIYFRDRDDLYNYFIENMVKPYLTENKIEQTAFMADIDVKAGLISNNFNKRGFDNAKRILILSKLNDNLKLFKYIQNYKVKYEGNPTRYGTNYRLLLQVFYITNYGNSLLNWNESSEYSQFKKDFLN